MLIMPVVEYYTRSNGRQPVAEWRDGLDKGSRANIDVKRDYLGRYGLELLGTEMLKSIFGDDQDFYELRGRQCRIAVYYDRGRNTFVLLHGFRKRRQQETREIEQARRLLHEYLSTRGGHSYG